MFGAESVRAGAFPHTAMAVIVSTVAAVTPMNFRIFASFKLRRTGVRGSGEVGMNLVREPPGAM
jgi:hypothetical protein